MYRLLTDILSEAVKLMIYHDISTKIGIVYIYI